jgi:D-alanyl-D-alanine carboxypeptidase (penicillin-binding protein 5/6)
VIRGNDKLLVTKETAPTVTKEVQVAEKVPAPVKAGDELGTLVVKSGGEVLGEYPIVAGDSVGKLTWGDIFVMFLKMMFAGGL